MKKVLLASTALIGFAGAAAAEVSLSGYAEIGIKGGTGMDTQFHNDIDVTFNLSGQSDNGLEFGATIDLDEVTTSGEVGGEATSSSAFTGSFSNFNKSSVWVSGSFGKVTLGDTDGAFDWALTEVAGLTSLTDDHTTHAGFNGNSGLDGTYDGQIMRYEYSFGDFAVAVSAEMDDTGALDPVLGLGGKWSGDLGGATVGVGLGYQAVSGGDDIVGLSVTGDFAGGFNAKLNYSTRSSAAAARDWDHWGVSAGYTTGALALDVNYGRFSGGKTGKGWGFAANYDLGGGAVAMLGYGKSSGGAHTWSAGMGLSF